MAELEESTISAKSTVVENSIKPLMAAIEQSIAVDPPLSLAVEELNRDTKSTFLEQTIIKKRKKVDDQIVNVQHEKLIKDLPTQLLGMNADTLQLTNRINETDYRSIYNIAPVRRGRPPNALRRHRVDDIFDKFPLLIPHLNPTNTHGIETGTPLVSGVNQRFMKDRQLLSSVANYPINGHPSATGYVFNKPNHYFPAAAPVFRPAIPISPTTTTTTATLPYQSVESLGASQELLNDIETFLNTIHEDYKRRSALMNSVMANSPSNPHMYKEAENLRRYFIELDCLMRSSFLSASSKQNVVLHHALFHLRVLYSELGRAKDDVAQLIGIQNNDSLS